MVDAQGAASSGWGAEHHASRVSYALQTGVAVHESILQEVMRLEALLEDAAVTPGHESREVQALRLERALVRMERRRFELEEGLHPSLDLFEDERALLQARADRLRAKINWLRSSGGPMSERAILPPGTEHALWWALHELVVRLRTDPAVPPAVIEPWKRKLVERVRRRRAVLAAVVDDLERARDLLVGAHEALGVLPRVDGLQGVDPDEVLRADREGVAGRIEAARERFAVARRELSHLASQWPELGELGARPDWTRVPIFGARRMVLPTGLDRPATPAALQARLDEAFRMTKGLALWVEELAEAVRTAPPPR